MYVIVGAGVAGTAAVESMRRHGYTGTIIVVSDEQDVSCFRPALSREYLTDDPQDGGSMQMGPSASDERFGAICKRGVAVTHIDPGLRTVVLATDETLQYERLLIATGGQPKRLDISGSRLDGVHRLRRLGDAMRLREALRNAGSVLVIGAGPLGLDVAHAAVRMGRKRVTVIDQNAAPLASMMPQLLGTAVKHHLQGEGMEFRFGARPRKIVGNERAEGVTLDDGVFIPCELVFVAIGMTPTLPSIRGIESTSAELPVDTFMRTELPDIFCAGEAASVSDSNGFRIPSRTFHEAFEQGSVAGASMAGRLDRPYVQTRHFRTRYGDAALCMVGSFTAGDVVVKRGDLTSCAVFALRDGALVGAGAFNRPGDAATISRIKFGSLFPTAQMLQDPSFDLTKLTPRRK